MSLWWTKKLDLDAYQLKLIEQADLEQSHLVTGPPGSGKTNVLLRRAQFARSQGMPTILVLTYTRPLVEFIKTGCYDDAGDEIFPPNLLMTIESWIRRLYRDHHQAIPQHQGDYKEQKRQRALGAMPFVEMGAVPRYQAIMVDEAQDLYPEEVDLLSQWGETLFFVGDDRQKIHEASAGLQTTRELIPESNQHELPWHYRLAPKICQTADRILVPTGSTPLADNCHYKGPAPETVTMSGGLTDAEQLERCAAKLTAELRVYADLVKQGDRLGVIVPRKAQRTKVLEYLDQVPALAGRAQIVRASDEGERRDSSIQDDAPIYILTLQGCKGLEFRALHWLFADSLSAHHTREHYYTAVTRAKTDLDITSTNQLPAVLLQAYAPAAPMKPW